MKKISDEVEPDRRGKELQRSWEQIRELQENTRVQTALLKELFESAPEAIAVMDGGDRILRANNEFYRLFGYTREETVGQLINDLIVPDHLREEALLLTRRASRSERVITETVRCRKDGTELYVSLLATPVRIDGEQVATYGIYRDITDRRRAEEARNRLYARMSHEIRTPISAIMLYNELLLGGTLGPLTPG